MLSQLVKSLFNSVISSPVTFASAAAPDIVKLLSTTTAEPTGFTFVFNQVETSSFNYEAT